MKILVPVKRVIDPYVHVRVKRDETGVETENVKMAMNPFCEIALEQAVRLKEAGMAGEVIAVSAGPQAFQDTLRYALAVGADRAIHIVHEGDELQPLAVAKLLARVIEAEDPDLVLLGKQAIDGDHNQTGQMLAGLTGWPQATFVSKLEIDDGRATATREIDGGLQTLILSLPAVITVDLRLNEPRFAKLPDIMKAKRKPIEQRTPDELGVDIRPRYVTLSVRRPPERQGGELVGSIGELVDKLREAGTI
ncbi:MAG: electron transfer flavoprotein subunit beta/FixA family protein [Pseudomonadota bacterium]|nr:MAG: electron transfer flavoprotein subunit beta/FixA family protein [Pseudomonadota bacterium]